MKIGAIICAIVVVLCAYMYGCNPKLQNKVIKNIDERCEINRECEINLKEITDFEWDRAVIYNVGASSAQISDELGVDYTERHDMESGIIFVKDGKVVYEPEKPKKFKYYSDMV